MGPEPPREAWANLPLSSRFAEVVDEALCYWEPRRVLYNLVLAGVVAAHRVAEWAVNGTVPRWDLPFFITLAVLANVAYCAVYVLELSFQLVGLRRMWVHWRWVLLAHGILFAAVVAHFILTGGLYRHWPD